MHVAICARETFSPLSCRSNEVPRFWVHRSFRSLAKLSNLACSTDLFASRQPSNVLLPSLGLQGIKSLGSSISTHPARSIELIHKHYLYLTLSSGRMRCGSLLRNNCSCISGAIVCLDCAIRSGKPELRQTVDQMHRYIDEILFLG